jgi:F-type H+/Na+-transporting ATPase subunit beta
VVARARRLERFLTQPFFTTEQFTGLQGKLVSLHDALDGCERILGDEFKDCAERALYMIGGVDEATAKTESDTSDTPGSAEAESTAGSREGVKPAAELNLRDKSETPSKPAGKPQSTTEPSAADHES